MKTIIIAIFLLVTSCSLCYSQTSDLLYMVESKSILATYRGGRSLGFYFGGILKSEINQPFIYTTPLAIIHRAGLNLTYKNRISFMFGVNIKNMENTFTYKPEVFIKINPLRIILKTDRLPDLSVLVSYGNKFDYGFGLSIPFQGIY